MIGVTGAKELSYLSSGKVLKKTLAGHTALLNEFVVN